MVPTVTRGKTAALGWDAIRQKARSSMGTGLDTVVARAYLADRVAEVVEVAPLAAWRAITPQAAVTMAIRTSQAAAVVAVPADVAVAAAKAEAREEEVLASSQS